MNTIIHLAVILALYWFSLFAFNTLNEPALGVVVLGLLFAFLPLTGMALWADYRIFKGGRQK